MLCFCKARGAKEGIDPAMMDPENLIFQGNYELKHGNAPRAIEFINHALAVIVDLDPLLFWTPSGNFLYFSFIIHMISSVGLSLDQIERSGFLSRSKCLKKLGSLEVNIMGNLLVRAECVRCPWLLA